MDQKPSKNQEIERLIRSGDAARRVLNAEVASLKARLDVPARVRGSLARNPTGWLIGSAASGLAASLLFRRRPPRSEKTRRGLPFKFLALILTVVQPMVKVWLTGQLKSHLTGSNRDRVFRGPVSG